jgi:peptide/nickel transport system permease protein
LAPADPLAQDLAQRLQPPVIIANGSRTHLLGTDEFGRDLLSRLLFGARISLGVSVAAILLAGVVGVILGVIAGHIGGKVEAVILQIADVQLALPPVLLAIIVVAVLGNTLLNLIVVLAIGAWVIVARIAHSSIQALENREFVIAAHALGAGPNRIMLLHLLPNAWTPIIVVCTVQLARTFIIEASLSFLGLGIPAPAPAWGTMLNDSRSYLFMSPWLAIFPGIAIVATVLAINMFGDGLSEALDPKLRMA